MTGAAGCSAGDREAMFDQAAQMALADHLAGKDALLLAGSNAEAADLARRVQAKLVQMGRVGEGQVELADGNTAGLGDRIRARENTKIEAGGRTLNNRDTLMISAIGRRPRVGAAAGRAGTVVGCVPGPGRLPGQRCRAGLRRQRARIRGPHRRCGADRGDRDVCRGRRCTWRGPAAAKRTSSTWSPGTPRRRATSRMSRPRPNRSSSR